MCSFTYMCIHVHTYHHGVCLYACAGTDEKAIINVLAYRSNSQRQDIKIKFKALYGKVDSVHM